jgi:hypothetical protein
MREKLRFLGLDVHAETIAVAISGWSTTQPQHSIPIISTCQEPDPNRSWSIRPGISRRRWRPWQTPSSAVAETDRDIACIGLDDCCKSKGHPCLQEINNRSYRLNR